VQGVARAVQITDLSEGPPGLQERVDGLPRAVEVEQRPSHVDQGDAFSVPISHLVVQLQRAPVQVKSLGRPPEPLVGSAWASTPPLAKRMCFEQQLEWADRNKALQPAFEFLKELRESDWYAA